MENRPAILRKDFLIDTYQVQEARAYGADAVLLIVAILDDATLVQLLKDTRALGMEALVEVVSPEELARALKAGATVIGVNNRNLRDFTVDTSKTRRVLESAGIIGPNATEEGRGKVLLALSGIQNRIDVQGYRASGVHGVLVGEALMRAPDPTAMIQELRGLSDAQPLVKICGLKDVETAAVTAQAGADFIGLVFAPKSSRLVSIETAKQIVDHVRGMFPSESSAPLTSSSGSTNAPSTSEWYQSEAARLKLAAASKPLFFGVFANQDPAEVNKIATEVGLDIIQLSGKEGMTVASEYCKPVVKAVHVGEGSTAASLIETFKTGNPLGVLLDTKSSVMMGGTGETFDWEVAAAATAKGFPLFLAGGLNPSNIHDAVTQVRPFGVDVSSGVEASPGVKSKEMIVKFIAEAKRKPATAIRGKHATVPCTGYDVVVGKGMLDSLADDMVTLTPDASQYVVIIDENVNAIYRSRVASSFENAKTKSGAAPKVNFYVVQPGEMSKCRTTKAEVEDFMLSVGCDRKSVVVAVGGGVVGDLAGFCAATYMRGIRFFQVPTSLLAMVDSSIGGKTGIDVPAGKNLVGAFHRPERVYVDVSLLKTLPKRELCNGMAEIIKAAAIQRASLFSELETVAEKVLAKDDDALYSIIRQSIEIKTSVVIQDEKEGGLRALLNFGHSVGHGIEAIMAPNWLHGECVAVGMVKETEIARGRGGLAPDALGRLLSLLAAYNLPTKMPAEAHPVDILRRMAVDKKNIGGTKHIVILKTIGDAGRKAHAVEDNAISRVLSPGVELIPSGPLRATIKVPGSKSISNRVLLMVALGRGRCVIRGLLHSDDTLVMMDALQSLGCNAFEWQDGGATLVVTGVDGKLTQPPDGREVYLGNAGTASRFLTTACTLVAEGSVHLTGNHRMKERPIGPLVAALNSIGCSVKEREAEGCLPLDIAGGGFPGKKVLLSANISSQYVSSVLISSPYANAPTELTLTDQAVSQPYIDMTIALMKQFGVDVSIGADGTYMIPNTGYDNPAELIVESDASSASYPLALAAITGGCVTVDGIGTSSLQGDSQFCEVLRKMGCRVEQSETSTTVEGPGAGGLKPIEVDMANVTDTFMTAAAVMATVPGTSKIYNIANQRVKECDRIAATVAELTKCGIVARELPDGLEIDGVAEPPVVATPPEIKCYKDHRIAMSFGVLGSVWPSIRITDKDCTDKTYPSFWDDLKLVFGVDAVPWNTPERSSTSTSTFAGTHATVPCTGYDVVVGKGMLDSLADDMVTLTPDASQYVVIIDENVNAIYRSRVASSFENAKTKSGAAPKVNFYVVQPGEMSKCRTTKAEVEDFMLSVGCDRKSVVVAVGGGVVGDLAGFCAATYMRGIRFFQVPTSLLAMVDSSIGGKTGIDVPAGKNLVGAFHRPERVYVDVSLLKTLPKRELCNGMAEIIKAAAIQRASLFSELETVAEKVLAKDDDALYSIIRQSIEIKTSVVIQDEKEGGLRALLNFGHSVGHGIEAIMAPNWLHGECVAVGMVKETEIARGRGGLAPDALGRLLSLLAAYNLPTKMPAEAHPVDILRRMAVDKKNIGGTKHIVILKTIGDAGRKAHAVEDNAISRVLSPGVELIPSGPLRATIKVPGSKSISNRVLLMVALGRGRCVIRGLLHSDDTLVMMDALQSLGCNAFEWQDGGATLVVTGVDGKLTQPPDGREVYLGNAGTASRFLTTACTLVAEGSVHLTGNHRMKERPIGPLVAALNSIGCSVKEREAEGCLPLDIAGGGFPGKKVLLSANISSQYVSSVLISSPYANAPTELTLTDQAVSQPYIDMTIALMKQFGVDVSIGADGTYMIPNTGYDNPAELIVESDASSASYPLALAAITGGCVTVDGIGTSSLQGDSQFCEVLRKMGCRVEQSETSTTVEGPGAGGLKPIEVDMANVTDTFMTAAAVMATVPGTSKIYNIANQRVKECDRIAATVAELTKCGIVARELPDGLEIDGVAEPPVVATPPEIKCYKDHRIAMSFGVLGSVWPSIRITDKDCTDKTYPSFWDDLKLVFGVDAVPWNTPESLQGSKKARSVVVVGMRGAGKTTLGSGAAKAVGFNFIDLDEMIPDIKGLVAREGWPAFRAAETAVLREALAICATATTPYVISCGGGIIEAAVNQTILKQCGIPVVWVKRPIEDIENYLNADGTRPALGSESVADIYTRREPLYRSCSSHEYSPASKGDGFDEVQQGFFARVGTISGATRGILRGETFCSSLEVATLDGLSTEQTESIASAAADVHAVELRVDLLDDLSLANVDHQVRMAQKRCSKPIIFTVLPESDGGKFSGSEAEFWKLMDVGLRAGCDFLDVPSCWSLSKRTGFVQRCGAAQVIGSYRRKGRCTGQQDFNEACRAASCSGAVDIVRAVFDTDTSSDCLMVHSAAKELQKSTGIAKPVIAFHTGPAGQMSQLLGTFMTPVPHGAASQGSFLSAADVKRSRILLGTHSPRRFFLFGSPIQTSPSPTMHTTAFEKLQLPHTYGLCETADVNILLATIAEEQAGGGSVTIPLKQDVLPHMDELTPAASRIGAVNTIIVERARGVDRWLIGDNTDWIGVMEPIKQNSPATTDWSTVTALVVGAGGTSRAVVYGLQKLGCAKIMIYNRTAARAEELAETFGCDVCPSLDEVPVVQLVVSTITASVGFTLPPAVLESKPLVFDVNYKPAVTPLTAQASAAGCTVIGGIDMLIAQGLKQCELWTMGAAPAEEVRAAAYAHRGV